MIKIINFPFCNISSVVRCFESLSPCVSLLSGPSEVSTGDIIVLPGVGTFAEGMAYLLENNYVETLKSHAFSGGKIIGICLGMQLLLEKSDESPCVEGLSLIPGSCSKLPSSKEFLVPHIGWNSIIHNPSCIDSLSFLSGDDSVALLESRDFYFVHSYVATASDKDHEMFYFEHPNNQMVAGLCNKNILGFQFHPEKSGPAGYQLLANFLK